MIAVLGAGAMGAALAMQLTRAGNQAVLAGTSFDAETVRACADGAPHPALGVPLPAGLACRPYQDWDEVLDAADVVLVGVSSGGLAAVVADAAPRARKDATWIVATKGWDEDSLRSPSEVVTEAGAGPVAVVAGPALAPELVAGAPTLLVVASADPQTARRAEELLASGPVSVRTTGDVAGAETAAAYKNVVAIAVGLCEGLSERLPEHVYIHRYANARSAIFAAGLEDMFRLASARGGLAETIYGPAGAGDLYVTCLGGRNGSFGRLVGAGQGRDQALETIGSTVEGIANAGAALARAERDGIEVRVAAQVHAVLEGRTSPAEAVSRLVAGA